jgi:hypothetical protein
MLLPFVPASAQYSTFTCMFPSFIISPFLRFSFPPLLLSSFAPLLLCSFAPLLLCSFAPFVLFSFSPFLLFPSSLRVMVFYFGFVLFTFLINFFLFLKNITFALAHGERVRTRDNRPPVEKLYSSKLTGLFSFPFSPFPFFPFSFQVVGLFNLGLVYWFFFKI